MQRILLMFLIHANFSTHTNVLRTEATHAKILWTHITHTNHATSTIFFFDPSQIFMHPRHQRQNLTHATYASTLLSRLE